jgi:hypothetical protein
MANRNLDGLLVGVVTTLALLSCSGRSSVVPNSPGNAAPTPAAEVAGSWDVVIQTLSDTGPRFCIHQPSVGSRDRAVYTLSGQGDSIVLQPLNSIDEEIFNAKIDGLKFSGANAPVDSGTSTCAHYRYVSTIAGTFSPNHSSFTANVTWSFTLDSGEAETITFSWLGTRQG